MLLDLPQRQEGQVVLVIITDGGNSGGTLKKLAAAVANEKRVNAVWFLGVDRRHRETLKRDFSSLGRKLIISGFADASYGAEEFAARFNTSS